MTESQKKLVEKMRFLGYGYRSIANRLGLKRDTVRNYCKSKGLDGRADEFVEAPKPDISVCVCCGVPLVNAPKGRRKKYCSPQCKKMWEAMHPRENYTHQCIRCGKSFNSASKTQKYCSHDCYIKDRFYREEQMEYVIEKLKKGERVENTPQWIKDLLV